MGGVFYAYLWDRTGSVWPVSMAHAAVNIAFGIGAGAVVAGSPDDLAYVAGESGIGTFLAVAVVGVVLLARARVWRTDPLRRCEGTRTLAARRLRRTPSTRWSSAAAGTTGSMRWWSSALSGGRAASASERVSRLRSRLQVVGGRKAQRGRGRRRGRGPSGCAWRWFSREVGSGAGPPVVEERRQRAVSRPRIDGSRNIPKYFSTAVGIPHSGPGTVGARCRIPCMTTAFDDTGQHPVASTIAAVTPSS